MTRRAEVTRTETTECKGTMLMADENALNVLRQGVETWNRWREENPVGQPDLSRKSLFGITHDDSEGPLVKGYVTPLSGVNLSGVNLDRAFIEQGDLSRANLSGATLSRVNLRRANLSGADLTGADLYEADLYQAILSGAKLVSANLTRARLVETNLIGAILEDCNLYGIAAWDVRWDETTIQKNLAISDPSRTWETPILVDNLEVAQFLYLMLRNKKLRGLIDTVASKVVLILGRFTKRRKLVLDAIREELRRCGYVPVLFDFAGPSSQDALETVSTVAHLSRFIIADLTSARSVSQELQAIVPNLDVPVQPIIVRSQKSPGMILSLRKYPWFLAEYRYKNLPDLLASLQEQVINPAEAKVEELRT